jgi:AraC family transcriptional regulator
MTNLAQPPSGQLVGTLDVGSLEFGVLGRIASPRGIQVVALNGLLNRNAEGRTTTKLRALTHVVQIPEGCTLGVARQVPRPHPPTNFISPGIPITTNGRSPLTGVGCIFEPGFFAGLSETDESLRFSDVDYLTDIQSERMTYLGRSMFREAVAPGFGASLFAESIGLAVQVEISRYDGAARSGDGVRRGGLAGWQMRRIESYVGDNLSADITLDDLARLVGIGVRQLSRAVRREKGVSVHQWIAGRRLSEARRLLMQTDLPVTDIARRSAFHNLRAFTSAFHAASGFPPAEFRLLHAQ